jgi:hypothetical protein
VGQSQYQVCIPTRIPGEFRFHPCRIRELDKLQKDICPVEVQSSKHDPDHWRVAPTIHPIMETHLDRSDTFDDFVNALAPWEIDILRIIKMHLDPNAMCEALLHGLRAASDGSVRLTTQGAFNCALNTDNGRLQGETGMGPAYGLLSTLRFFICLAEFTGMVEPWDGVLATDSQSILRALGGGDQKLKETNTPVWIDGNKVVLDVLCPECWDVLIEN